MVSPRSGHIVMTMRFLWKDGHVDCLDVRAVESATAGPYTCAYPRPRAYMRHWYDKDKDIHVGTWFDLRRVDWGPEANRRFESIYVERGIRDDEAELWAEEEDQAKKGSVSRDSKVPFLS